MKEQNLMTAMKTSISEVIETMFFEAVGFLEEEDPSVFIKEKKDELLGVNLRFSGPFSGDFQLFMPRELAFDFSADFLGTDRSSLSTDQVYEVVKELSNMVAGGIFSNYDDSLVFNLGIPETVDIKDDFLGDKESRKPIPLLVETMKDWFILNLLITRD